jgi:hypothetical protein
MISKHPARDAADEATLIQSCEPNPDPGVSSDPVNMSKLSDAVKALVNAGHAKPGYTRASAQVKPALARFASDAAERNVSLPAWVTMSV